ncbi:hydroxymethylglutaryl-CoA synthase [Candidatus Microgenomates bacterium]|nr:hydroxymethylglutaryl-CoA synthase [Candidatus Microgenomates bacterium]
MVGIISYGFYIPRYRIKTADIAGVWGKDPADIEGSLRIKQKAVAGVDEDSLTMGYESAAMCLSGSGVNHTNIGSVLFGSETPPYSVNPTSTILAEFLGIKQHYLSYDMQFACKAATGGIISTLGLIKSGDVQYGLVTGSDKANAKVHDALEYTAGSGSVSVLLGKKDPILNIHGWSSFSSDTPDFWRREGIRYPSHGGRFTGKPSYFHHVRASSSAVLEKTNHKPQDFKYAVFHMPNGKFPLEVGLSLGFTKEQILPALVITQLGNSYTASALMGLVAVLDVVQPGEKVFFASYGSGAGSDAFVFEATENIKNKRRNFKKHIAETKEIDYTTYLKFMGTI